GENVCAGTAIASPSGNADSTVFSFPDRAQRPVDAPWQQDHSLWDLNGYERQLIRPLDAGPGGSRVIGAARSSEAIRAHRSDASGCASSAHRPDCDRAFSRQRAARAVRTDARLFALAW